MDHGAVLRTAVKIAAAGIEPTAFWLWARWLATCLRCDKADPPAGLAPAFCPLPTDRSAISAWMEWKLDVPTGNAPVASVLQTEWFTCSIGHEIWSGAWDLHPPGRLHRPECCWLHHHLEKRSSGRSRTGMVFFTKEVHCWLCHGGMKLVLPRGLAPRPFAFARRHARLLHLGS